MISHDLIESVARAIYKALSVQGQSISIYKFEAGDTWIDGEFDLSLVARAAIEAVLLEMRDPSEEMIEAVARGVFKWDYPKRPKQYTEWVEWALSALADYLEKPNA